MKIPSDMLVSAELHGIASELRPDVFRDGDSYCVLYGQDPQTGIFGCGASVDEALEDWDGNLRKAMSNDVEIKRIIAQQEPPESVSEFILKLQQYNKKDDTGYDLNKSY